MIDSTSIFWALSCGIGIGIALVTLLYYWTH